VILVAGLSTAEGVGLPTNGGNDSDDFEIISRRPVIAFMPCVTIARRNQLETVHDRGWPLLISRQHDAPEP